MKLHLVPCSISEAKDFVRQHGVKSNFGAALSELCSCCVEFHQLILFRTLFVVEDPNCWPIDIPIGIFDAELYSSRPFYGWLPNKTTHSKHATFVHPISPKCLLLIHSHASYREVAAWHCPGRPLHKLQCEVKTHQTEKTRSLLERVNSVFDANRFQGGKQHSFFDFYGVLDSSQEDCREWMIVLNGGDHSGIDEKLTNSDEVGRCKFHSHASYHHGVTDRAKSLFSHILKVTDSLFQAPGQRNHLRNKFEVPLLFVLRVMQSLLDGLHISASYHREVAAGSLAPSDEGATHVFRPSRLEFLKNIGLNLLFIKPGKIGPRNSDFDSPSPLMDLSEYIISGGNGPGGNPSSRNALSAGPSHHRAFHRLSELICHSGTSYHRDGLGLNSIFRLAIRVGLLYLPKAFTPTPFNYSRSAV